MRAIKELLYIIALLCSGGVFGFLLSERALLQGGLNVEGLGDVDLSVIIESTLTSSQFAFVLLGFPLSLIVALIIQFSIGEERGRIWLFFSLLGFAALATATFFMDSDWALQSPSLFSILVITRIIFSGLSLIAMGFAYRAQGDRY